METEKELQKINERLITIENKLEKLNRSTVNERPAWISFVIAFSVTFIIFLLVWGVYAFIK